MHPSSLAGDPHIGTLIVLVSTRTSKRSRKTVQTRKDTCMFKRSIRWLVLLLVLAALAIAFIVTPMIATHAATSDDDGGVTPTILWPNR